MHLLTVSTLDDDHVETAALQSLSQLHLFTVINFDQAHVGNLKITQGDF